MNALVMSRNVFNLNYKNHFLFIRDSFFPSKVCNYICMYLIPSNVWDVCDCNEEIKIFMNEYNYFHVINWSFFDE